MQSYVWKVTYDYTIATVTPLAGCEDAKRPQDWTCVCRNQHVLAGPLLNDVMLLLSMIEGRTFKSEDCGWLLRYENVQVYSARRVMQLHPVPGSMS